MTNYDHLKDMSSNIITCPKNHTGLCLTTCAYFNIKDKHDCYKNLIHKVVSCENIKIGILKEK